MKKVAAYIFKKTYMHVNTNTENELRLMLFLFVHQNSHLSQAFQFFVPVGARAGLHLPSSMFVGQMSDKRASPELSADEQLACRWRKVRWSHKMKEKTDFRILGQKSDECFLPLQCHLLFDSLQDLVDHVNDFHVKPEKDSGYCCHWEGCARKGRGFNAR